MTMKTWISDFIKSQLLAGVLGFPLISAMLWTIQRAGPSFVTYMMLLIVAIQLIMIPAYPYLLAPIFNKYKPLSHPDFKEKKNYAEVAVRTEKLAKRLGFPLGKVSISICSPRAQKN
jgi:STE24 endopeptidase